MIQPLESTQLGDLLHLQGHAILDVRSPKEFAHAHIPDAKNLALLNDEERHIVGITYKEQGNEAAVQRGFELVGHKFAHYILQAKEIAPSKKVAVYCWRGGLRSGIISWLLSVAGFEVVLIKGGYKRFRNLVLAEFQRDVPMTLISGKTGTGKTELLYEMNKLGESMIDLEALANHKGSVYGALGLPDQPSIEHFENLLAWQHAQCAGKTIWLENESRWIGKVKIPDAFFGRMKDAKSVIVDRADEIREERIINEYGHFPVEDLIEKTKLIANKMGGENVKAAIECLEAGDYHGWVKILLRYYDRTYLYGLNQRDVKQLKVLSTGSEMDMSKIALQIANLK